MLGYFFVAPDRASVPPATLGYVECTVGMGEDFIRGKRAAILTARACSSYRYRKMELMVIWAENMVTNSCEKTLRKRAQTLGNGIRQDDDDFISTVTRDDIGIAADRDGDFPKLAKDFVPGRVSIGVVDDLKVIYINDQNAGGESVASCHLPDGRKFRLQMVSIVETGKFVANGELANALK